MSRAQLRQLYRQVPKLECKGLCEHSCGPIAMTTLEARRIETKIGRPIGAVDAELRCPLLTDDGRCSVYELRPLICRMWGASVGMECPHGCVPTRWLSKVEGAYLVARCEEIGGRLVWTWR